MTEIIKIFVGEGDTDELSEMARIRRAEGWTVGKYTDDKNIWDTLVQSEDAVVEAEGGSVGDCLAGVVAMAYGQGASEIHVNLERTRAVTCQNGGTLIIRALLLQQALLFMAPEALTSDVLEVQPKEIWDQALENL
jgi:hypothetical protein